MTEDSDNLANTMSQQRDVILCHRSQIMLSYKPCEISVLHNSMGNAKS